MLGVATADAALARINWPHSYDDPAHPEYMSRPRVIVEWGVWEGKPVGINTPVANTSIVVRFERPAYERWSLWPENFWPVDLWPVKFWPEQEIAVGDRLLDASNVYGVIMEEVLARSGATPVAGDVTDPDGRTYPEIFKMQMQVEPGLSNPAEADGEYYSFAMFSIEVL